MSKTAPESIGKILFELANVLIEIKEETEAKSKKTTKKKEEK